MNKDQLEHISELKSDLTIREKKDRHGKYKVKILYRGEGLYYEDDNKALICEIGLLPKIVLFTKTIKKWDNGCKVTNEEKLKIYSRLKQYFLDSDNEIIELYSD